MITIARNYESLYIVDPTLTDEQVESIVAKYANVITEQGGEVLAAGRWDKRRLAYDVSGRREGIYILMYSSGEPAVMGELDRLFRIGDDVFRHIIVRVEPEHIDTTRIERAKPSAEEPTEAVAEETAEIAAEPGAEAPAEEAAEEAPANAAEEAVEAATEEPAGEAEAKIPPEGEAESVEETKARSDEEKSEEIGSAGSNDQPKKEDG